MVVFPKKKKKKRRKEKKMRGRAQLTESTLGCKF